MSNIIFNGFPTFKDRCSDCPMLSEDEGGIWYCCEYENPCSEIADCGEWEEDDYTVYFDFPLIPVNVKARSDEHAEDKARAILNKRFDNGEFDMKRDAFVESIETGRW